MAGFLVYRSVADDKNRIPFDIGAVLVNGASGSAAITNAITLLNRLVGPHNGAFVNQWTAVQLSSSDFGAAVLNTTFQGECVLPGQMLRGGGITV